MKTEVDASSTLDVWPTHRAGTVEYYLSGVEMLTDRSHKHATAESKNAISSSGEGQVSFLEFFLQKIV